MFMRREKSNLQTRLRIKYASSALSHRIHARPIRANIPSLTYILPLLTITLNLALLQLLFALLHLLCANISFVPDSIASFKYSSMSDFNNYGGSEEEYASVRKFAAETVRQPPLPIARCHRTG